MKALPPVRTNRVKQAILQGRRARGFHMIFPSPHTIELLGTLDFDFVYLDAEHGRFDLRDVEDACRVAELGDLTVVARVPAATGSVISLFLDRGVQGIVVPHVSTAQDVREAVDACFFRPKGYRSSGGARADRYWTFEGDFEDHFALANANTTLSIQIEDRRAVDNLDEILAVPGVDYYTVGKNDLGTSYDYPRLRGATYPDLEKLVQSVVQRIRDAGGLMKDDVMALGRVKDFILAGGRDFMDRTR